MTRILIRVILNVDLLRRRLKDVLTSVLISHLALAISGALIILDRTVAVAPRGRQVADVLPEFCTLSSSVDRAVSRQLVRHTLLRTCDVGDARGGVHRVIPSVDVAAILESDSLLRRFRRHGRRAASRDDPRRLSGVEDCDECLL